MKDIYIDIDAFMSLYDYDYKVDEEKYLIEPTAVTLINLNSSKFNFFIINKGTKDKVDGIVDWKNQVISPSVKMINILNEGILEEDIDMQNSIFIGSKYSKFNNNALMNILYTDDSSELETSEYSNKSILIVNKWSQIVDIIKFYLEYNFETLNEINKGGH